MPYCNQCQLVHGEEHRFCQRCGQLLKGSDNAAARACARCGTLTFPGQKFCTECGLPLRMARVNPEGEEASNRPPLFYPRRPEPMARRKKRRPGRFISLIVLVLIVVGGIYFWRHLQPQGPLATVPTTSSPRADLKPQVQRIVEKIRSAQLNKDIDKWLSAYSSSYKNLGQLENRQLELWKNYDIKEVSYHISNVKRLSANQASADVVWNIQLYDHRSQDYNLMRLSYRMTLENGPGGWKIISSKEIAGG
jgi:RNA polymerase subunit RPABC4/transcription elongation factor Spt4